MLFMASCLATLLATEPEQWTRFRGPGGSGKASLKNLPVNLSKDRYSWNVALNGKGHGSAVIFGKKVFYTVTPDKPASTRCVVCVSTTDGSELWRSSFPFKEYHLHQFNSFSSSTPVVDAQRIYLWWAEKDSTEVLALDHDGKVLWKRNQGSFKSQHGSGSSLALADGVLLIQKENLGGDSFIAGLTPATGDTLWKHAMPTDTKTPYATPLIRDSKDGAEAIYASTDNGIVCLDTNTGKQKWVYDAKFEHRVVGSPVLSGEVLFASCGSGGGGKASITLHVPIDTTAPKELYRLDKQLPYVPTAIGTDGLFFLVSDGGIGSCVDAKSGEQLWRQRLVGKCFSSPILVDDKIYVFGRDGDYQVYKASKTFESLAEGEVGSGVHATPSVGDQRLFIRTDTRLICIPAGKDA